MGPTLITVETGPQPADSAGVRATNTAAVLRYVRTNAPCSRADIAAATGLHKTSVSSIVADLIDRRLLREVGMTENRVGRPATMLVPDGEPYATIGLEVGTDELTALAVDLSGARLLSWRRAFTGAFTPPGHAVATIAALAARAAARVARAGRQVLALTVGVPGMVDGGGKVRLSSGLGWRDVDLRRDLTIALRRPSYPVVVDSDANLAVQAEHRYGTYAGVADLVFLTGGARIGAGVITDGRLLRGSRGFTGELGHLPVIPDGPACPCGRLGCLQTAAGIPALIRRALPDTEDDIATSDLGPEIDEIVRRARVKDATTLTALADAGRWLGHGASILANVVNPELVIVGGHYTALAEWLLPHAEAELRLRSLAPDAGGCRIVPASLAHEAVTLGSAARTLDHMDAGHAPLPRLATA
jgi:predicted NBD/HSP70 family sugar kinase